jgi:hypothetical protein
LEINPPPPKIFKIKTQIYSKHQNCVRAIQTFHSGPLPPSHAVRRARFISRWTLGFLETLLRAHRRILFRKIMCTQHLFLCM